MDTILEYYEIIIKTPSEELVDDLCSKVLMRSTDITRKNIIINRATCSFIGN
jgi:hypothetical protein